MPTPGKTHITGHILGYTGSGKIVFVPVDSLGRAISVRAGGDLAGTVVNTPIEEDFTGGYFTVDLYDTNLARPQNFRYRVMATDADGNDLLGPGYDKYQPSGLTDDFDDYIPDLTPLALYVPGLTNYQLAVLDGFGGTLTEWLATQVGPRGPVPVVSASVTMLAPDATATVTRSGPDATPNFAFAIPSGPAGPAGANSQTGTFTGSFGRQTFVYDGTTLTFTKPATGTAIVFVGSLLDPGADYTETSTDITLLFTPSVGMKVQIIVFRTA